MAGNGGAPRGFLGHRMPFSSGGGPRFRPKLATAAAAGVGVLAVGGAVYHHHTAQGQKGPRLQLQPWTVAAFAGAIGEVAAIALLYPLDTIKVRCQAAGMTAKEVVADLLRENGFGLALFRKLWAGVTAGMLCSVIVGAVHFASYDTARRFILPIACPSCKPSAASSPHDSALTHFDTTGEVEAPGSEDAETRRGKMLATFMAAALAAVATALIESPVELFRHNAQAGLVRPNFIAEMYSCARKEGLGGLYWGFLPHCFEAWPHDISELFVYGAMHDFYVDSRSPSSKQHALMANVPIHAWDLATGAASGAAAVLMSMPLDVIKTYMQTHGTDLTGKGFLGSAKLFIKTGQKLVARKGLGALYVGVTPRLFQQVPSAMVCWWAIEAFTRALEPYTVHATPTEATTTMATAATNKPLPLPHAATDGGSSGKH